MSETDSSQQLSKQQNDSITKPTVVQGWNATSQNTLNTIFGTENLVFSPPDITNAKQYEPLAVIGQVKQNEKYKKNI